MILKIESVLTLQINHPWEFACICFVGVSHHSLFTSDLRPHHGLLLSGHFDIRVKIGFNKIHD